MRYREDVSMPTPPFVALSLAWTPLDPHDIGKLRVRLPLSSRHTSCVSRATL